MGYGMSIQGQSSFFAHGIKLYFVPGTSGHAQIYKNAKGKKLEEFKDDFLSKIISKNVDFGASIFPKGQFILLSILTCSGRTSPLP